MSCLNEVTVPSEINDQLFAVWGSKCNEIIDDSKDPDPAGIFVVVFISGRSSLNT